MATHVFDLDYKVPLIDEAAYVGNHSRIPFDACNPHYDEPLVPLETVGIAYESYYARIDGQNWPYGRPMPGSRKDVWLRKSVAGMLSNVNVRLKPFDVELFVLDGYRAIECHRALWDFFYAQAARQHPDGDTKTWCNLAAEHAGDPSGFDSENPTTWPVHSTGAAVDLTLRDLGGDEPLDMGSRFEDINAVSATDYFERELIAGRIAPDDIRLWGRRLLHWAMLAEGFVNDPFVFWHHDWGSQLYVKLRKKLFADPIVAAWYGYVPPP